MLGLLMIIFFSNTFTGMVMGRFLQGLGTGCCAVLARASTRDRFSGPELPVALSYIAMAASITPLVAPLLVASLTPTSAGPWCSFHYWVTYLSLGL